jgi:putative ABC transport system permease protein
VALGAGAAILLGRALQGDLFGVRSADPASLAVAGLAFGVVALAASLLPAFRAARTDLLLALHQD